jgi:2-haloacid dehalogenase
MQIDWSAVRVLTFDCYGTLIDWESGISRALGSILAAHHAHPTTDQLLTAYAAAEAEAEAADFIPYREVLARSARAVCARFGVSPTPTQVAAFAGSVGDWPPFPDSRGALARLASRYRLGVITNCDDDLFSKSAAALGDPFTWVITAQQAHSYKPSLHNFELAFDMIGVPREQIVHVAQSLYHDHVPAASLGMKSVWINRRHDQAGSGATPPATARPTLTAPDMKTLARIALEAGRLKPDG